MEVLDWLRGVAALWVVAYHVNIVIQKEKYFGAASMGTWADVGHRGVDLFFVLSGFIMSTTVLVRARNDWVGAGRFLIRRVMRVFPAYLAVFLPLTVVALLTGIGASESGGVTSNLLPNLLLLPRDDLTTYVPVVAWTLTHELAFYILFATVFLRKELAIGLLATWSAVCVLSATMGWVVSGWQMLIDPVNLYFLIGVAAASIREKLPVAPKHLCVISFITVVGAIILDQQAGDSEKITFSLYSLLYTLGFAGMIIAASSIEFRGTDKKFLFPHILGRQSYSIYLVHYPVIIVLAMILSQGVVAMPPWMLLPLGIVATLIASWFIYVLIEAPGIRLGRRLTTRRPAPEVDGDSTP